ncbi:MAG: PilZ domain-containing protein [Archangium sp.]
MASPTELAGLYYPNGRLGGLSIAGKPPGVLGERVKLLVQVHRPARQFELNGQLGWVRHKPGPGQPPSFGVDFLPEDDATRVRLLAFARQEVDDSFTRAEQRQQVALQVRVVHDGVQRKEHVADLSTGGAFVRTWNPLPVGSRVTVYLRPPLALTGFEVRAEVAWVRSVGDHAGMGLAFDVDEDALRRLEKLLTKLAR